MSVQYRGDRAGLRVEILKNTQAPIGDQKVAVAVERDPVRLAAGAPHTANSVLVDDFCDSGCLVGGEHPAITSHHNVFRAIHPAPDGV
ncbi:hypothetical protein AWC11_12645 [Mycobacterium interjectum]|nr:hypothetical protein AWC11_12645 [Mycobacterium interjectum]